MQNRCDGGVAIARATNEIGIYDDRLSITVILGGYCVAFRKSCQNVVPRSAPFPALLPAQSTRPISSKYRIDIDPLIRANTTAWLGRKSETNYPPKCDHTCQGPFKVRSI